MAKKKKIPQKLQIWIDIRKQLKLTHAQIQMARELGMTPKSLKKLRSNDQSWKSPLPQYLAELYNKRFGRAKPLNVRSIEELAKARNDRRAAKKARRERRKNQPGLVCEKISETILNFGDPILSMLGDSQDLNLYKSTMSIVITIWNAHVLSKEPWNSGSHLAILRLAADSDPILKLSLSTLSQRYQDHFSSDCRAVGEWAIVERTGQLSFQCEARMPGQSDQSTKDS